MKYLFLFIFLLVNLEASSVKFIEQMKYETSYEKALLKAKEENKILMMIATTKSCPWCRKLERQTLKKDEVDNLIKTKFIPLSVDQDLKNFPSVYEVKVVPTIYFINPKDETVIEKVLGYKNKNEFMDILQRIVSK